MNTIKFTYSAKKNMRFLINDASRIVNRGIKEPTPKIQMIPIILKIQ